MKKRSPLLLAIALLGLLLVACEPADDQADEQTPNGEPQPQADQAEAGDALHEAFEDYFQTQLERNPLRATFQGDHRFNDRLAITISPEFREESLALEEQFLEQVRAIDPDRLDHQDRLSREIFLREREQAIEGHRFPSHLLPLNQFRNFGNTLAQLGSGEGAQPFEDAEDYHNFLGRMEDFSTWVDQAIDNMREGMERDVVQPSILMERTRDQLDAHVVDDPEESLFWRPVSELPDDMDEDEAEGIRDAYRETIREVLVPAYARLRDFVDEEYLPETLEADGMHALPEGDDWYAYMVAQTTTTDLSPAEIHQIGLDEVERIHGEMRDVMEQVGFEGSLDEFFEFTAEDEQFYVDDPEELIQAYEDLRERVDEAAKALFDLTPEAEYEIRAVEPYREQSAAGASYMRPAPDGSRPGVFYVNTYDLSARPLWAVESLFLHEAVPGHHFQIALQQEQEHLPRFRQFGGNTAFIEGWALYAEAIGPEMGMYEDPYQYFGMLNAELWRAIRLVVDTGLHYHGWSRDEVLDYMYENSAVGEARAVSEAERYMAIPSQALAYKIGQLEFQRLREEAEEALGEDFDIQSFHNMILRNGAVPLDILEQEVQRWVEEQQV
ncbi:uncharacterized protein (DUF885 family) [Natronospira proteinivora]|uniref:Uncharacterized protein (DUF885 family) n=1 Tax=Natronospira proteinivora TaxID=1807133 RepID=A0ABT1GA30_9GAMM|nr:DUF885 domain-containing protein [Natronospira proteinivora]MCP1728186.1 uncharacterized protein (DUF885 family) [Natronospira proteinivora]